MAVNVSEHNLVPKHSVLKDKEKQELLDKLFVAEVDLPKILFSDPAIEHLSPKVGDVIQITRSSMTAGTSTYYRVVING